MQRTARAQQAQLARSKRAVRVSFSTKKMRAGDLLYWKLGRKGLAKSKPSHTGIYIGRGMFIHASGSKGVTISKLKGLWTRKGKVHSAYRIKSKLN